MWLLTIGFLILTALATLAVIGAVAFLVVRAELRKDPFPTRRSRHDRTYGKRVGFIGPEGRAGRRLGDDADFGDAGSGGGGGGGGD